MANTQARSAAEIEQEIALARESLAAGIAALIDQVHPKAVARRGIAGARQAAGAQAERVRVRFTDADGHLATKRVAIAGSALAGLLALVLIIRAIVRR